MKYYININKLGKGEQECSEINCCRNTFWKKQIETTEHFYKDLRRYKELILIPELDSEANLVLHFTTFFKKSIELTVVRESLIKGKSILICELNAYFQPSASDEQPF